MQAVFSEESYAIVEKMASKFAYGKTSLQYENYLNVGLEGLIKALKTYSQDCNTDFSTYAYTCVRNALCTSKKKGKRFDLQQDENIELDEINNLLTETTDDNMEEVAKQIIYDVNNHNTRNADMFMAHIGLTCEPMSYNELSAKFNVSPERVRQVCVNTMRTIKNNKEHSELLYSFVG